MARTRTLGLMLLAATLAGPAAAAEGIAWRGDFEAAKREAASTGRLVLLHFSGTFCPPCRAMEQTVFNRADVAQSVEQNYVPVAVDVEKSPELSRQFGIRPIPADVIVTPEGQVIHKSIGAKSPQDYVAALSNHARLARKNGSDRQAAWQPGPSAGGIGQPPVSQIPFSQPPMNQAPMNQGPMNQTPVHSGFAAAPPALAMQQPGAEQPGAYRPGSPPGEAQFNPLAPRVGQQHPADTMLQPPPPPDAGNRPVPGADSNPFGPPAHRSAGGSLPPWQQQDSSTPSRAGQGSAPGNPFANPQAPPPWVATPPAAVPPTPGTPPAGPPFGTPSAPAPGAVSPGTPSPPSAQLPPLGFAGYRPVAIYHEQRWVAGDRRWGVIHEGRLYLFASEQAKEVFRCDFNRYAPVLGGDDVVLFVETGRREPGQVRIGAKQGDKDARMYLFANELSYQKFEANPAFYLERLRQMTSGR